MIVEPADQRQRDLARRLVRALGEPEQAIAVEPRDRHAARVARSEIEPSRARRRARAARDAAMRRARTRRRDRPTARAPRAGDRRGEAAHVGALVARAAAARSPARSRRDRGAA